MAEAPTCCYFLSIETGVNLIALVIAVCAVEVIHMAIKHKVVDGMAPIIAMYVTHTLLFLWHRFCGWDGVFIRRLLFLTSLGSTFMNLLYGVWIVDGDFGGI